MAIKHRVSRMEERIIPTTDGTVYRQQVIRVPEGLTRGEQQAFMDRYKDQEGFDGPKTIFWRLFIVGMPTDPFSGQFKDANA